MVFSWRSGPTAHLPVVEAVPGVLDALAGTGRVVLAAPPGAGKTTVVPLALLDQPWCGGTVVVVEPRRLAVRAGATRMAALLGERPGATVGWRMRDDTRVSARTRIEVVTEGVLTRRLQNDPGLDGVSVVVFDEFHERSLDADLGLALTMEVMEALRPELRLVVMSATLDLDATAALIDAPVVSSPGRLHPVEVVNVPVDRRGRIEREVAPVVARAVATHPGDVLVFLPGRAEIDRVARELGSLGPTVDVRALHGTLPGEQQEAAIAPCRPGRRKVVLSTSIAETSLTIEGVTVVVDAGWRRAPRLDPGSGMSRLVTLPVTRAEAEQRAGRAGRLGPGTVYRCWSRADHAGLRPHPEPEIEVADLTPLALDLAAWGTHEDRLAWLSPPPASHLAPARALLVDLGALDPVDGRITDHGRVLASLPLHPRLGHLLIRGAELGRGDLAVEVAAVLGDHRLGRAAGPGGGTDLAARLDALRTGSDDAARRARTERDRLARELARHRPRHRSGGGDDEAGMLLALGFPDRVGRIRPGGGGEFLLANGRGAFVDRSDPLATSDLLVAADLDGDTTRARVRCGAPIRRRDLDRALGNRILTEVEVGWADGDVVAREMERIGAVVLVERPLSPVPADRVVAALVAGIRAEGVGLLPWTTASRGLQARLGFLHRLDPGRWPAVDDDALVAGAAERIGPHLTGCRRRRDLDRVDLTEVLLHGLAWTDRRAVDELAPERLPVPSGHHHRVDYATDPPVLAVKLQELFGSVGTPTVGGGRVPVVLHLLSPAGRPVQVTQDLPSFWATGYARVRADLRGRYPRHPWPEDPTTAEATARTRPRR